jgi:hypothetical protein
MPTTQVVRWFAGPLMAAGIALGGCGGPTPCRTGTLQVNLTFDSTALQADSLAVTVTLPGGSITAQKTHLPGMSNQTIILDLGVVDLGGGAGYTAGASYSIEVLAQTSRRTIAYASLQGTLSANCTLQSLILNAGVPLDLAPPPPPDLGVPPDQATPVDQSTSDQSLPAGG